MCWKTKFNIIFSRKSILEFIRVMRGIWQLRVWWFNLIFYRAATAIATTAAPTTTTTTTTWIENRSSFYWKLFQNICPESLCKTCRLLWTWFQISVIVIRFSSSCFSILVLSIKRSDLEKIQKGTFFL